jgi:formate hydrogenlyase subunit 3/multisubunit Na+/H+ antiporter MnhD subunit
MRKVLGTALAVVLALVAVVLIVLGISLGVFEVLLEGRNDDDYADWFMAILAAMTILVGVTSARLALAVLRRT